MLLLHNLVAEFLFSWCKKWQAFLITGSVKQGNLVQFFTHNIEIREKGYLQTPKIFTYAHKHHHDLF